ncbi:MAG: hypothetical protein R3C05_00660 [Pirellulaceae bacterium]
MSQKHLTPVRRCGVIMDAQDTIEISDADFLITGRDDSGWNVLRAGAIGIDDVADWWCEVDRPADAAGRE